MSVFLPFKGQNPMDAIPDLLFLTPFIAIRPCRLKGGSCHVLDDSNRMAAVWMAQCNKKALVFAMEGKSGESLLHLDNRFSCQGKRNPGKVNAVLVTLNVMERLTVIRCQGLKRNEENMKLYGGVRCLKARAEARFGDDDKNGSAFAVLCASSRFFYRCVGARSAVLAAAQSFSSRHSTTRLRKAGRRFYRLTWAYCL